MTSRFILGLSVAVVAVACGGTVVFEEDGAGGSGASDTTVGTSNPSGGASNPAGGASNPSGGASNPSGGGSSSTTAPTTGTVDPSTTTDVTVTVVGTTGPGPGSGGAGPSGGGFDPSSGPSGVGGADNGSANGQAAVTSGSQGGCSTYIETTNQYCYLAERCDFYLLEVECETNGDGPYSCWCYQDGNYQGTCTEPDAGCSAYACCESFWVLPR